MTQIVENLQTDSKNKNKKLDEYKDKMSSMLKRFEDKMIYEKTMAERKVEDKSLDEALSFYLQKLMNKFHEFSEAFEGNVSIFI